MKTANLLLALDDDLLRRDVAELLEKSERPCSFQEQSPSDWRGLLNRVSQDRPEIMMIELDAIRADLMNALRAIKKSSPQTKIVALHSTDDPQAILAAMRAGASEFIHPPFDETFVPALERVIDFQADEQQPERRGKVIGFLSAKGGCGSTTLACHVAADLRRQTDQRVLLADLDLTSGMVGFLMKVAANYSILDAVTNLGRLDESLWKALVAEWKPGIGVIPSPDDFSYESAPTRDQLRQIVRFMRTQHDWIVLDLGRSFNEAAAALYQEIDELLLISVLEVSALHGLKTIAQKLRDRGEELSKLQLVLNRTPKMMDITHEDLQKVLGRPLYAMLPNDYPSLYQAYSAGTLLPANNRLAQQFSVLTTKLAGIEAAKPQKKFSLFR
jgi:pilus assembly protein CpaE